VTDRPEARERPHLLADFWVVAPELVAPPWGQEAPGDLQVERPRVQVKVTPIDHAAERAFLAHEEMTAVEIAVAYHDLGIRQGRRERDDLRERVVLRSRDSARVGEFLQDAGALNLPEGTSSRRSVSRCKQTFRVSSPWRRVRKEANVGASATRSPSSSSASTAGTPSSFSYPKKGQG
jgi:hypothetical protein